MNLINTLTAILFGIVEGITEWLPVSSTGHMILLDEFLAIRVGDPTFTREFYNLFEVVIQLGAILAVIILFWEKLWPFSKKKSPDEKKGVWSLWLKVVAAIIPSAVIGVALDDLIDAHLAGYETVAIMLIVYGVAFVVIERFRKRVPKIYDSASVTYKTALLLGAFQALSLIPGTSRSGAVIVGGLLIGLSRATAAEFCFFMAIPTMAGASLIRALKFADFVMETDTAIPPEAWFVLGVGALVAFLVSYVSIKFLMDFVRRHSFTVFGVYRIALGVLVLLYFLLRG